MSILSNAFGPRHGTPKLSRRDLLKLSAIGTVGYSMSGWMEALAQDVAPRANRRACILLWMDGGPSQLETFDMKPRHANGGLFREIPTSIPGIRISEHLPRVAANMHDMALIRSMSTPEADHTEASFLARTGYRRRGPVKFPTIGSLISKELGSDQSLLPNFVSIYPNQMRDKIMNPGFLGPRHAHLGIGPAETFFRYEDYEQTLRLQNLQPTGNVSRARSDSRIDLLLEVENEISRRSPGVMTNSHATAYDRAVRLMRSSAASAFNLDEESAPLRDRYGRNLFGQGCLLARRLVERGVPFVEVTLATLRNTTMQGWDTHTQNFRDIANLCEVLDPAWSALMEDLRDRGMFESTLVVWMGEFGRTPRMNREGGRDHWSNSWTTVLGGGGIFGGQAYGQTSPDGTAVESAPTDTKTFLATLCRALGIDYTKQNMSNTGRPIRIVDAGATHLADIVG